MDFNSKDFPSRKSKSLQWLPVVCSFIVGTGVLCAIVAVLILASKAKLKLPGHWAVQLTASGESISTTHFLQKLWPDFTEGRDRGEVDVVHKHSSTFGIFYVNNTPVTMTKFSVFFHTSANGQQALHEVLYGLLDAALGLGMTRTKGIVLDVGPLYERGLFKGNAVVGLFNLLRQAVMWMTNAGSYVVGAHMPYHANLTKLPLNYTITGMDFVDSAARLLVLDAVSGQHDRPQKNCMLDATNTSVVAVDNGATFDNKGFKFLDLTPSILHGNRTNPGGCLPVLSDPHQVPPGQTLPADCLMVQRAVQLVGGVDLDAFAASFKALMLEDELIHWYLVVWRRYYRDPSAPWGPCLARVVGQAVVEFYEQRVQAEWPLPDGEVCGVDIVAFWANMLRVRMAQFVEAARVDLGACTAASGRPATIMV